MFVNERCVEMTAYHAMPESVQFLLYMKDYLYSLAQEINTCPYYSQSKILRAIDSFYKGNENQRQTVEWWLTFELWRRSHTNK
jgi:hypothetical protein